MNWTKEQIKQLFYDYITNLEEEIEKLHIHLEDRAYEQIKFLYKDYKDYKSRIDKAIEYIKEDMYVEPKELYGLVDGEHLLNILQGEDRDNGNVS